MSECMHLRCATCQDDAPFTEENRGTTLKEMAKAAPLLKQVHELGADWLECYVEPSMRTDDTGGVWWLAKHAEHELVLVSEYMDRVTWSSVRGEMPE